MKKKSGSPFWALLDQRVFQMTTGLKYHNTTGTL